ncbi:hypothetical protein COI37_12285 [Neisseria meningitidis]|nr:hypothetical protein COI37_12285 [Neisseria meningitidis]RQJ75846.1 hypothetical protein COI03_12485 [Neisseria meningitidis]RQJ76986.1 hypothetical protein COI06_12410 [Neisseria meningitidis]RQJ81889.1 hypothetical protein COI04_12540 [Neisseria meningitidis]RQK03013.1 hypothetical protein COH96_12380 [Neisseria meningitidis]
MVRRALFAPSPCPRSVASETGGVGASPRKIFQIKKHFFNEATVPFKKGIANEIVGRIDSALDERRRPYIDCIRLDGGNLFRGG